MVLSDNVARVRLLEQAASAPAVTALVTTSATTALADSNSEAPTKILRPGSLIDIRV